MVLGADAPGSAARTASGGSPSSEVLIARSALLVARDQHSEALDTALAAAAVAEALGMTAELACSLSLAAIALERVGRHADAAVHLRSARAVLTGQTSAAGQRFARPAESRPHGADAVALLSARELEIVELAGRGYRNAEIADRLTLSRKTVENHLSRVFAKLGVSSRMAAAALLADHHRTGN